MKEKSDFEALRAREREKDIAAAKVTASADTFDRPLSANAAAAAYNRPPLFYTPPAPRSTKITDPEIFRRVVINLGQVVHFRLAFDRCVACNGQALTVCRSASGNFYQADLIDAAFVGMGTGCSPLPGGSVSWRPSFTATFILPIMVIMIIG